MAAQMAAEYSGTVYADLNVPVGANLEFIGGLDINFSDDYFTDPTLEPTATQDSWTMLNARIGVGAQGVGDANHSTQGDRIVCPKPHSTHVHSCSDCRSA